MTDKIILRRVKLPTRLIIVALALALAMIFWTVSLLPAASVTNAQEGSLPCDPPDLAQSSQNVFTNSAPITINDAANATPYPSTITVSGMTGTLPATAGSVKVTLNGFSHTFPDDVGIVLVGPTGAALLIQDGAGDTSPVSGVTYTISDTGGCLLPDLFAWTAGTYKPANYYFPLDSYPAPGPGTTYNNPGPMGSGTATFSSTFGGTNPNGLWSLYVKDFSSGNLGSISGGWTLELGAPVQAGGGGSFTAYLNGPQEVPVNASTATGKARVVINTATNTIFFTVTFTGLTSNQVLAHIHAPAPVGVNGGIAIDLGAVGGTSGTITGSASVTPTLISQIGSGLAYINIHTSGSPGGEIRGQLARNRPVDYDGDGRMDFSILRFPNVVPPGLSQITYWNLRSLRWLDYGAGFRQRQHGLSNARRL